MQIQLPRPTKWAWLSPWMIIGSVCILAIALLVLAVKNINREKQFMMRSLLSEANMLINSLEASSRTGMMGMGWGQRQLQLLLQETAQQPDVLYVRIVDPEGHVLVDSNPGQNDLQVRFVLPQAGQAIQRFVDAEERSFEVIRSFQPWFGHRGKNRRSMSCPVGPQMTDDKDMFIVVGLDPSPFEQAREQDLQQTVFLFGIIFLVGAAGIISLVWAQHYRSARCSLNDVTAFTSTLVEQMPLGLVVVDQTNQIKRTNDAARRILKTSNLSGEISRFLCFEAIIRQLTKKDAVLEQEVSCPTENGENIPLLINASVIRDGQQETTGYVLLLTDITPIRQLEEQLRRSERLAALGRLAAGIAHEIRNPLSSIKGFAAILAGRFKEDENGRKIAEVMGQEVERLNRVVTELLDFARPTELKKAVCRCSDLIQRTLRLIEKDAAQHAIVIEWHVEPENLELEVDQDRFAQVLLNLYLNALQAMEQGGVLRVEAAQHAGQVTVKVSDSGNGIDGDHLPHIFDPYFTTKPRGVGLGLANVLKLVESHGGDIKVESSPGQKTSFVICLPSASTSIETSEVMERRSKIGEKTSDELISHENL